MRFLMVLTLVAGGLAAAGTWADTPAPFPKFEAKRIKAPKPGSRPGKLVQIDPTEQKAPAPRAPVSAGDPPVAPAGALGRYAWFWDKVSPEAAKAGPGRLDVAMTALAAAVGKVPAPRLQQMQTIARANGIDILRSTIGTDVSPALVLAVITVESSGNPVAISRAGAQGLMQLMPGTARDTARQIKLRRPTPSDLLRPETNIRLGTAYLREVLGQLNDHPVLATAAYNAGPHRVKRWLPQRTLPADLWVENIPFRETRHYTERVLTYAVIYDLRLGNEVIGLDQRMPPVQNIASLRSVPAFASCLA